MDRCFTYIRSPTSYPRPISSQHVIPQLQLEISVDSEAFQRFTKSLAAVAMDEQSRADVVPLAVQGFFRYEVQRK